MTHPISEYPCVITDCETCAWLRAEAERLRVEDAAEEAREATRREREARDAS